MSEPGPQSSEPPLVPANPYAAPPTPPYPSSQDPHAQDPHAQDPRAQQPYPRPPYPPQPYPYPYPPYGYPYPPAAAAFNTYAILAAVFAFMVFAPLGIYFGTKAKQQIAQTGERGIELAQVGIIGGWILTGLQAALLVLWCALAGPLLFGMFGARGW